MKLLLTYTILATSCICFAPPKTTYALPVNRLGNTSIHTAALDDDDVTIETMYQILPKEINRPSEYNKDKKETFHDTPAHIAAFHGCWKALTMLVACGADLTLRNDRRNTPAEHVLTTEQPLYNKALTKGLALKKLWSSKKAISIDTQTDIQQTTAMLSCHTQTDSEKPYQEITIRYYGHPVSIDTVASNLPPPPSYDSTISHPCMPQSSLNKNAPPYHPQINRMLLSPGTDTIWNHSSTEYDFSATESSRSSHDDSDLDLKKLLEELVQ